MPGVRKYEVLRLLAQNGIWVLGTEKIADRVELHAAWNHAGAAAQYVKHNHATATRSGRIIGMCESFAVRAPDDKRWVPVAVHIDYAPRIVAKRMTRPM
jgi:hypothetical protein